MRWRRSSLHRSCFSSCRVLNRSLLELLGDIGGGIVLLLQLSFGGDFAIDTAVLNSDLLGMVGGTLAVRVRLFLLQTLDLLLSLLDVLHKSVSTSKSPANISHNYC